MFTHQRNWEKRYLIEGEKRALVIDTGMEARPLAPVLSTLTERPLVLALTHAHPDHMYHADEFQTVCLGKADIQAWRGPLKLATDVLVGMRKLPKKKVPGGNLCASDRPHQN